MGQMILKVSRERDLYMVWSSVVDNAVWVGTKDELVEGLVQEEAKRIREQIGREFERADERGTSARAFVRGGFEDTDTLLVRELDGLPPWGGKLHRKDFEAYAEALMVEDNAEAARLVAREKPDDWGGEDE
jgi:hypothetical protein